MKKLTELAAAFVEKHGRVKTAELIGKQISWVDKILKGQQPSVADLEKMVLEDSSLIAEMLPADAFEAKAPEAPLQPFVAPQGRDIYLLMPTNRQPHWALMKALLDLYDRSKMRFWVQPTNFLPRGRNQLADRFLKSDCQWSLWIDDDVVPPHGDAEFFKAWTQFQNFPPEFLNVHPIMQLLSRNEKFISGCYFRHNIDGKPQFADGYGNPMVSGACHSGPRNLAISTTWTGFGWTLVHRSVFEDVIKQAGDELLLPMESRAGQGYTYRFFSPIADEVKNDASEDVYFCARALRAGHRIFVDQSVYPAHVGMQAFGYWNTRGVNPHLR